VLIAREAGAAVVDSDGSPHQLSSSATIAAPPALLDQIIPLIRAAAITSAAEHASDPSARQ
jgi:myo-inositol-1(or 4)-monophosphatase